jgi:hypothetical protein
MVTFSQLHAIYLGLVTRQKVSIEKAVFVKIWNGNYVEWNRRFPSLVKEMDFMGMRQQMEDLVHYLLNSNYESNDPSVKEAIDRIRSLVSSLSQSLTKVALRNGLTELTWVTDAVRKVNQKYPARESDLNMRIRHLPVLKKLLEMATAGFQFLDFLGEVNSFMKSERVVFDAMAFTASKWKSGRHFFKLALREIEGISGNFVGEVRQALDTIVRKMKSGDMCQKLRKSLDFLAQITVNPDSNVEERLMETLHAAFKQVDEGHEVRHCFSTLKTSLRIREKWIRNQAEIFINLLALEDSVSKWPLLSSATNSQMLSLRNYVAYNFFMTRVRLTAGTLRKNLSDGDALKESFFTEFCSYVENLLGLLTKMITHGFVPEKRRHYANLLLCFLEFVTVMAKIECPAECLRAAAAVFPNAKVFYSLFSPDTRHTHACDLAKKVKSAYFEGLDRRGLEEGEAAEMSLMVLGQKIEDIRLMRKAGISYEHFLEKFVQEPQDLHQSGMMESLRATQSLFVRISRAVLAVLSANMRPVQIHTTFVQAWVNAFGAMLACKDDKSSQDYANVFSRSIPFFDLSKLMHDALLELKVVESELKYWKYKKPDVDCKAAFRAFAELQSFVWKVLISGETSLDQFRNKQQLLLTEYSKLSNRLLVIGQECMNPVTALMNQICFVQDLHLVLDECRPRDETKEPMNLFANFVLSILRGMTYACRLYHVPKDVCDNYINMARAADSDLKDPSFTYVDHLKMCFESFSQGCEVAKGLWTLKLLESMGDELRCQSEALLGLMHGSNKREIEKLLKIARLSAMFDDTENRPLDQFTILSQIRKHLSALKGGWNTVRNQVVESFLDVVLSGIRIIMVVEELKIADVFIARKWNDMFHGTQPDAPRPLRMQSSFELPYLLEKFEKEIEHNPQVIGPGRELVRLAREFLARQVRDVNINGVIRMAAMDQRICLERIQEKKRELQVARVNWLENQVASAKELIEMKDRLDSLRSENFRLQNDIQKIKIQIQLKLETKQQVIQNQRDAAKMNDWELMQLKPPEGFGTLKPQTGEAIFPDLSSELNVLIAENLELRRELGMDAEENPAPISGKISALTEDLALVEEIDVEGVENDLLEALDEFKRAKWTDREVYRKTVMNFMAKLNVMMDLDRVQQERNRKLKGQIEAMDNMMSETKSALMKALEEEEDSE